MSLSTGTVIFIAFKPIIKVVVVCGSGAWLARMGLLSPDTCKGLSFVAMNLFYPFLVFSKVVPAFDIHDMKQVGILALTAALYMLLGPDAGSLLSMVYTDSERV